MELVHVGYIILVWYLWKVIAFIWKSSIQYLAPLFGYKHDLRKYGKWAVVTGSTDGIGLQYALQLAAKGFNIVLISRSEEKLQIVSKQIEEKFNVKTKVVVYDFSEVGGYDKIIEELEDLDIGILVNNVGTSNGSEKPLIENDLQNVFKVMKINIFSCVGVSYAIIKGMCNRKRGLMIHISSIGSLADPPYADVYPASKMFMNKFVKCLSYENEGIIDHQVVLPGYVESKLSGVKARFFVCPTAENFVQSAIGTIGFADVTCGYWGHEVTLNLIQVIQSTFVWRVMLSHFRKTFEKRNEENTGST